MARKATKPISKSNTEYRVRSLEQTRGVACRLINTRRPGLAPETSLSSSARFFAD
ncbi:conserved hypothetical protein [Coccidioides posadasii str. Silveira]|uniref:Uncharacterized protein n=1 Tax=Coccidioides posadasii (strain RMSCC 757 / Silveira) TaxID=443226 RepID=E9D2E5_COCPS|nr:conserved hypothetical protein [Coccidioides posadasii str. Silveira]